MKVLVLYDYPPSPGGLANLERRTFPVCCQMRGRK